MADSRRRHVPRISRRAARRPDPEDVWQPQFDGVARHARRRAGSTSGRPTVFATRPRVAAGPPGRPDAEGGGTTAAGGSGPTDCEPKMRRDDGDTGPGHGDGQGRPGRAVTNDEAGTRRRGVQGEAAGGCCEADRVDRHVADWLRVRADGRVL